MATPKNRIELVNWRKHGDDESYTTFAFLAADENESLISQIEADIAEEHGVTSEAVRESLEENDGCNFDLVYYVNDDVEFADGDVLEDGRSGRAFRITITEVKADEQ